jgi:hypothetical protein
MHVQCHGQKIPSGDTPTGLNRATSFFPADRAHLSAADGNALFLRPARTASGPEMIDHFLPAPPVPPLDRVIVFSSGALIQYDVVFTSASSTWKAAPFLRR